LNDISITVSDSTNLVDIELIETTNNVEIAITEVSEPIEIQIETVGIPGPPGAEVEFNNNGTYIQWRYVGDAIWINLVALVDIKGDQGIPGTPGVNATNPNFTASTGSPGSNVELSGVYPNLNLQIPIGDTGDNGRNPEFQNNGTYIQYRLIGDLIWINLILLTDIKGDPGLNATDPDFTASTGLPGTNVILSGVYPDLNLQIPRGDKGDDGDPGTNATNPNFTVSTGVPGSNVSLSGAYPNLNLEIPRGNPGDDGEEVELQKSLTHIQWRYVGDVSWTDLVALTDLKGIQGIPGIGITAGEIEIDFGSTPTNEASISATGLTDILITSSVEAYIQGRSTSNNTVSDHEFASIGIRLSVSEPTAGVGFTIKAFCLIGFVTGKFKINWRYTV